MERAPASALSGAEGLARILLFSTLSARQHNALSFVVERAELGNSTLTSAARESHESVILSEPAARRLIQKLRKFGLVECGDRATKGTKLSLTPLGEKILGDAK